MVSSVHASTASTEQHHEITVDNWIIGGQIRQEHDDYMAKRSDRLVLRLLPNKSEMTKVRMGIVGESQWTNNGS